MSLFTLSAPASSDSLLAPRFRNATLGMTTLVALIAFEALAVAAAMPTVAHELNGLRLYGMAFGSLLAASVIGMVAAGQHCDRHGPAAAVAAGLTGFIAGLVLAGLASSMPMLVLGRVLQGLGAGSITVALYVVVARLYPPTLQPRVFSAFSAGWVLPSLFGPSISGLVVEHLGWRWVFLGVPLLALPAAAMLYQPLQQLARTPNATAGTVTPWPATLGAAGALLALYLGGQLHGAAALLVMAIALLALLLCCQRLLPAGSLRAARGLPSVVALRGLAGAAFFSCETFIPLLLSRERGLSPWLAGVALSIGALGWFCASWYQGHSQRGWSRQQLLRAGAMTMVIGIAIVIALLYPLTPVPLAIAGWALAGLGMGLVYPSLSVLVLQLSPPQSQGANSSALQLAEAITVAALLAAGGSLFAWMLTRTPLLGYGLNFTLALLAAVAVWLIAPRTRPHDA